MISNLNPFCQRGLSQQPCDCLYCTALRTQQSSIYPIQTPEYDKIRAAVLAERERCGNIARAVADDLYRKGDTHDTTGTALEIERRIRDAEAL